jgi:hypothetical protein
MFSLMLAYHFKFTSFYLSSYRRGNHILASYLPLLRETLADPLYVNLKNGVRIDLQTGYTGQRCIAQNRSAKENPIIAYSRNIPPFLFFLSFLHLLPRPRPCNAPRPAPPPARRRCMARPPLDRSCRHNQVRSHAWPRAPLSCLAASTAGPPPAAVPPLHAMPVLRSGQGLAGAPVKWWNTTGGLCPLRFRVQFQSEFVNSGEFWPDSDDSRGGSVAVEAETSFAPTPHTDGGRTRFGPFDPH